MSNIYDWFERDEIKTAGKDDKNAELITYYYKCKVCLGKMNDEQLKKYKGVTANRRMNSNLHTHLSIDCALHKKAKADYILSCENKKAKPSTPSMSFKRKFI